MNTYLAIITTVLVITQVIRLVQNTIQLRRQKILFEKQLGQISDITEEDFQIQRKFYRVGVEAFDLFLTAFYNKATEAIINDRRTDREPD